MEGRGVSRIDPPPARPGCLGGGFLEGGCLEGGCLEGGCLDPAPARPGGRAALPAPPGEAVVGGGGRGGGLIRDLMPGKVLNFSVQKHMQN